MLARTAASTSEERVVGKLPAVAGPTHTLDFIVGRVSKKTEEKKKKKKRCMQSDSATTNRRHFIAYFIAISPLKKYD